MTRQQKKRAEEEAEKAKLVALRVGQEDAAMVGTDGEDYDDEDDDLDEDDDEGLSSEEVSEDDEGEGDGSMTVEQKRRRKAVFKNEQKIANRALRIKMGKSGAQAATRKNIKKGKDACQRKLWG
jgi:hypothetical protein